MNVLVVDVGGTHVKILATGQNESRRWNKCRGTRRTCIVFCRTQVKEAGSGSGRPARNERSLQMNPTIKPLTERRAWQALAAHQQKVRALHLRQLFADDPA